MVHDPYLGAFSSSDLADGFVINLHVAHKD